ncbi:Hybrid sensor histidine kinase/response regulator (fragment) [uncultured Defluviicoccus sp.]|uniref:Hybrid sensor histidine kinase/response regulator n=1 Tax=metagenome TaxID=256318 RepID=A0A380TEG9_9ZZZZ
MASDKASADRQEPQHYPEPERGPSAGARPGQTARGRNASAKGVKPGHAERLQALGEVALDVAHDFRNLLTAMLNGCELMLDRHGPEDPLHEDLTQVLATAERARALAEELLMFARGAPAQAVPLAIDGRLLALAPVLDQLVGADVTLTLELEAEGAAVLIAPNRFDQVLFNLAANAGEAMADGGRLVIRSSRTADAEGRPCLQIDVIDSGPGIAPEVKERIFEPFVTTKAASGGTGLGLAMVMRVAAEAGGRVQVESVPGQGACFSVVLPVCAEETAAATPPIVAQAAAVSARLDTQPAVIMLVEDEDAVRTFAARALSGRGYEVIEAASAEDALAALHARCDQVDLVISDLMLPGMDGLALADAIRARGISAPFLLVSGYAIDGATGEAAPTTSAAHGVRVVPKPYTLSGLLATVAQSLEAPATAGEVP